ncbi:hypothetical protein Poly51_46510 [Rubripirellula tenax]|uniref:Uncharacterized protein n=1 Tax=Rubripirellula tenax TaxID=2528015 RepID=A0A5C6EIX6_9BACT|nr:hypothetical protein [Rubripirellula tenax]TWU48748.1 hypothetical protein Poly51_46510 [Rubripirellula tenax]
MSITSTAIAVAVNPAFLQEIKDSNPDLWSAAEDLRNTCRMQGESTTVLNRLTRLLDNLRDAIALQFSLEESYGYIAVAEPQNEDLARKAAAAQAQHGPLYLRISDLAERAEELQYRGFEPECFNRLVHDAIEFDHLWSSHEQLEADLVDMSLSRQAFG